MRLLSDIQRSVRFNKTWHIVVYLLLFGGYLAILFFPRAQTVNLTLFLTVFVAAILILVLVFYDVRFGYYGMISFAFLLAFLDRLSHSAIPFFSILFLIPALLFISVLVSSSIYKEDFLVKWHPLVLGYLVITVYGLLQVFNPAANSFLGWVSYLRQEISFLLLLFISFYILKDLKSIRFFFKFIFGAIMATALYGIFQQYFGIAPWDLQWLAENPDLASLYSFYGLSFRKFSFLSDPANFGVITASGGLGLLILGLELKDKRLKVILFVSGIITLWSMSFSGTRTANLMVAGGLALYVMMTIYRKRTWIFMAFATFAILFILFAPIYNSVTLFRIRTSMRISDGQDASMNLREINRQLAKPYIRTHPFGGGVNTTGNVGLKYDPGHFLAGFPPDGHWFAVALEQGTVGLALHLAYMFLLLFYGIHYYFQCRDDEIRTYYVVMVVMLFTIGLLGGYTQFTLTNNPQFLIYIPFIVIIAKLKDLEAQKKINY